MVKLLFICAGNICRSPTAEGIFRHRVRAAGLEQQIHSDSAGLHGFHRGEPPDRRAIAAAQKHGIEIGDLRARPVTAGDLDRFDIIAVMEQAHRRQLLALRSAPPRAEISLLLGEREIPDPYYDDHLFLPVYRLIEQGVETLFDRVQKSLPSIAQT